MSHYYEIIIYTAAESDYADKIIDYLEKDKKYFAYRLYKEQCVYKAGSYMFKHLDILCPSRDLKDIVLLDNSVRNFALSVRNGIPIKEFKGSEEDKELAYVGRYLRSLANEDDLRNRIKDDFANFLLDHYQSGE